MVLNTFCILETNDDNDYSSGMVHKKIEKLETIFGDVQIESLYRQIDTLFIQDLENWIKREITNESDQHELLALIKELENALHEKAVAIAKSSSQ